MPQQNHGLQTFEYHFKFFQLYHNYFSFISLGWENWKYPQKYSIDNFGSSENQFIFQYTVSGEGAITINSHTHVLRPGQAFLIERPGATHYFRPKNSAHWELQFLSMNAVCGSILRNIINEYGNIYTLPPACPVLNCWKKLYGLAVNKQIHSPMSVLSRASCHPSSQEHKYIPVFPYKAFPADWENTQYSAACRPLQRPS